MKAIPYRESGDILTRRIFKIEVLGISGILKSSQRVIMSQFLNLGGSTKPSKLHIDPTQGCQSIYTCSSGDVLFQAVILFFFFSQPQKAHPLFLLDL